MFLKERSAPNENLLKTAELPVSMHANTLTVQKRAVMGSWVTLEPHEEEQTEGAVGGGG